MFKPVWISQQKILSAGRLKKKNGNVLIMAFEIADELSGSVQVVHLFEQETGLSARISPTLGWNLFELHLPVNGKPTPILMQPPSPDDLKASPSRYGNPILFPFPNRIRQGQFQWQGKAYNTPVNNGGNAIHGFALKSAWRVTQKLADKQFAQATAQWRLSIDSPEHLSHWPADAQIEITYRLDRQSLKASAKISNPDSRPLPWGLGYHTYFQLPFSQSGSLALTKIVIPASQRWQLRDFLPSGAKEPLPANLDFRQGLSLKGLKADDVLTDLAHNADGRTECLLMDTDLGWEVAVATSRSFRELVVFTPSWNPNSIALEPYTQTTDAINLAAKGLDGGLSVLAPGQSETLDLWITSRKSTASSS